MGQLHPQEGDFVRTSHGPQTPMAPPKSYEPGHTHGSHACDLRISYFMPRSHDVLGKVYGPRMGQACVNTWEITRHRLRVRTMFRKKNEMCCISRRWACTTFKHGLPAISCHRRPVSSLPGPIVFGLVNIRCDCAHRSFTLFRDRLKRMECERSGNGMLV